MLSTNVTVGRVNSEFGVRSSEFGIRSSEFGIRNSEFGVRSSEFGMGCGVWGVGFWENSSPLSPPLPSPRHRVTVSPRLPPVSHRLNDRPELIGWEGFAGRSGLSRRWRGRGRIGRLSSRRCCRRGWVAALLALREFQRWVARERDRWVGLTGFRSLGIGWC